MIRLTFILKITTIQVVVIPVTVNNSPIRDYNNQHNCIPSTHEALLEGGGVGMYVSSNFKYGLFVFRGVSHVVLSISPIFMLFVTISSSFM